MSFFHLDVILFTIYGYIHISVILFTIHRYCFVYDLPYAFLHTVTQTTDTTASETSEMTSTASTESTGRHSFVVSFNALINLQVKAYKSHHMLWQTVFVKPCPTQ